MLLLFAVGALMLLLSACGAAPASETDIRAEITDTYFFSNNGLTITSYEEITRKTSSKDGYDLIDVRITAENDSIEYHGYYNLEYRKYDNGWVFEHMGWGRESYTVKSTVPEDMLNNDIVSYCEWIKDGYNLDALEIEKRELFASALTCDDLYSEDENPYCSYIVRVSGENEYGKIVEELYPYYEFDIETGWEYQYANGTTISVIPKAEPDEQMVPQALNACGYHNYELSSITLDGDTYKELSYLEKDSTTYKYITIYYDVDLALNFDISCGWYVADVTSVIADVEINATGRWEYDDGKGKQRYVFDIEAMNKNKVAYQCEITLTDTHLCISEHTWSGTTGGETREKEWEKTSKDGYCLRATDWTASCDPVVLGNETICYYLEFCSYSGDRYDESGFYFNDRQLKKVS